MLGRNTYLLFNSDFRNLMWETSEGRARKQSFVIFFLFEGTLIVGESLIHIFVPGVT